MVFAAALLTAGLTATACQDTGGNVAETPPQPTPEVTATATPAPADNNTATPEPVVEEFSYPMDSSVTVTWWMPMATNWQTFLTNFGESAFSDALIEATGVNIEWMHPPSGQHMEAFGIMAASGDYPDIIEWRWTTDYQGGAAGALADRMIISLNEPKDNWAPNYVALLERYPQLVRQVVTDEGDHFAFPFLRIEDALKTTSGPIIRRDWLDELGLDVPGTIPEWEVMLTRFRDEKGATTGFTGAASSGDPNGLYLGILSAWEVRTGFFIEGDTVLYGFTHDNFRDFLETMARWYAEGLIDSNIMSTTRAEMDAAILSGASGAVFGPGGGALGPWLLAAWENEPGTSYDLTGARFPSFSSEYTRHGGTSHDLATGSQGHAAISSSAREIETITRLLDFGYSEEGNLLYNFGPYGVSWEWANGVPTYTDMVNDNPDGRTFAQALSFFARANVNGPFDQDGDYLRQFYSLDQQREALIHWTQQGDSVGTMLPPVSFTQSEAGTISARMADLDTHRREWVARFITGETPVNDDTWATFVADHERMGLPEVTAIHQAALDRYNQR